jgi:hypothetical protein
VKRGKRRRIKQIKKEEGNKDIKGLGERYLKTYQ